MESSSQATIDALLEELNAKDEHIKQVSALSFNWLGVRDGRVLSLSPSLPTNS